jgi:mRNA interferase RelE/StbE
MSYQIQISAAAKKALSRLPKAIAVRADRAILSLGENPRPAGSVKLAGTANGWRIRVSDWRILYTIEDDRLVVLVVEVGHRREVYRRM